MSSYTTQDLMRLLREENFIELTRHCEISLSKDDNDPFLLNLLGVAHISLQNTFDAERCFLRANRLQPNNEEYKRNLRLCQRLARTTSKTDLPSVDDLNDIESLLVIGNRSRLKKDYRSALSAYERAHLIAPENIEVLKILAISLVDQDDQLARSSELIDQIHQSEPDWLDGYLVLGIIGLKLKNHSMAAKNLSKAIERGDARDRTKAQLWFSQLYLANWSGFLAFSADSAIGCRSDAVPPFSLLPFEDKPLTQLRRSVLFSSELQVHSLPNQEKTNSNPITRHALIKVGLFSADFHNHATMLLIRGLLEKLNPKKIKLTAFSFGPNRKDESRASVLGFCSGFHDIRDLTPLESLELISSEALDIAIDLKGFTTDQRAYLFKSRVAPIQISYLGYPGSTGMTEMDYLIADGVIIPPHLQEHYSEQILYLPNCYQPNDSAKPITDNAGTRTDHGLPTEGFVFCCFNNVYKISPAEFDIWMRLLAKTPRSVIWLLKPADAAIQNLGREAEVRGIDPNRLIFAPPMNNPDHLARQIHADLFLDTFNVNAHTTCSDALWAGLPVVTKIGNQFSARVSASLLTCLGLPELITRTEEEYESLALTLASRPELLTQLKAKVSTNLRVSPLFDTDRYARDFEKALGLVWEKHLSGAPPSHTYVH